jgi:hypothetical protein
MVLDERNLDVDESTRLEDAPDLSDGRFGIANVFENRVRDDDIHGLIRERKIMSISDDIDSFHRPAVDVDLSRMVPPWPPPDVDHAVIGPVQDGALLDPGVHLVMKEGLGKPEVFADAQIRSFPEKSPGWRT